MLLERNVRLRVNTLQMMVSNIQVKGLFYDFRCPHCHQEPHIDYLHNPEQEFTGLAHNPGHPECVSFDEEFNAIYKQSTQTDAPIDRMYKWLWKYRN